MTSLMALWLPIVVSSIIVFLISSLIHMVLPWHKSDYPKMPNEERFSDAVRPLAIPPGDYMVPRPADQRDLKSPEFQEKVKKGPVMVLTVLPNGPMAMGSNLLQWFCFSLVVGVFSAYVAGRALPPGSPYLPVFRFAGVTAFLSYTLALWPMSIWYKRAWSLSVKATIDGLIYGLLTAGTFGWLWPK